MGIIATLFRVFIGGCMIMVGRKQDADLLTALASAVHTNKLLCFHFLLTIRGGKMFGLD